MINWAGDSTEAKGPKTTASNTFTNTMNYSPARMKAGPEARIGNSCNQQHLMNNVDKLTPYNKVSSNADLPSLV